MSTPMTVPEWQAACARWGVPLNVLPDAATHTRNGHGGWGDVHGLVLHHFGSATRDAQDLPLIHDGYAGLPGPLSQLFLGDDCVVDLVSTGRCNHAGKGSRRTLEHLEAEDYTGTLSPGPDEVDFNAVAYGVEIGYSGTEWMGDRRYRTTLLLAAAVCDHHGWSEKSVIAHYELTGRKWDPGFRGVRYDMAGVRNDIRILLQRGHGQAAQTSSTAKTPVVPSQSGPVHVGADLGAITLGQLRPGGTGWSVQRYKECALAGHGPAYQAAARARYGAAVTSPVWDAFATQVTRDLYAWWARYDASWATGDTSIPGPRLLRRLGFTTIK